MPWGKSSMRESRTARKTTAGLQAAAEVTAELQLSSSQKQSVPRPLLCDMHTWSTMNLVGALSSVGMLALNICRHRPYRFI